MTRAPLLALSCLLTLVSAPVSAAFADTDLDRLALKIWQVRAAFHNLTVTMGDPVAEQKLAELIDEAESVMQTVTSHAESDSEQAFIDETAEPWQNFLTLAQDNTIAELGYTDHYTIIDMESAVVALSESLAAQRQQLKGDSDDLLDIAVDLQRITSEYLFISSSPDGGSATMATSSDGGRLQFVDAVPALDARLKQARADWQGNPDVLRELESVITKWSFIRDSLVKFYENAVPFLVKRYSAQMVDSLLLAAEFAGQ